MYMQKIKRTEVKRTGGIRAFLKSMIITMVFILLFAVGFFAAFYIKKIL